MGFPLRNLCNQRVVARLAMAKDSLPQEAESVPRAQSKRLLIWARRETP